MVFTKIGRFVQSDQSMLIIMGGGYGVTAFFAKIRDCSSNAQAII
jgi:hypothetical protein